MNLDKELWFDFGQPKKLSKTEFEKTFGHLRFDSALQYVALPQVEILDDDDSEDEEVVVATRTPERSRKVCLGPFGYALSNLPNFVSDVFRTWFPSLNGSRKRVSSILLRYKGSISRMMVREAPERQFANASVRSS